MYFQVVNQGNVKMSLFDSPPKPYMELVNGFSMPTLFVTFPIWHAF